MPWIEDGRSLNGALAVEKTKAARVAIVPRTVNNYGIAATTGVIAAALGANSAVFAMRLNNTSVVSAFIERVRLEWTCITGFTVPISAGRRLAIYRGAAAVVPTGGTSLADIPKKSVEGTLDSRFTSAAQGGSLLIATTGALTAGTTSIDQQIAEMSLAHTGAAGAYTDRVFEFAAVESAPLVINPGQILLVRNPIAMDAVGTWQLSVRVDWHEAKLYADSGQEI